MDSATHIFPKIDSSIDFFRPGSAEIAALAYQFWKDRGCPIGSPEEDWLLAEAELTDQQKVSAAAA